MGSPFLSLRFTIIVSLSFSLSAASSSSKPFSFSSPSTSTTAPKATPSDLLSVLGPKHRSSTVDPLVARQLNSCFKFLVPFTPTLVKPFLQRPFGRRSLGFNGYGGRSRREEDELIWWPPQPVLELARLAFDSGGDPGAIHAALDPTIIPVPDVEGCKENRCELTRTPYGWRFISEVLYQSNKSLKFSLYIRFHAKEYPAFDKEMFPYNMGYCQIGSNVTYDDSMNLRNILWLAPLPSNSSKGWDAPGILVVLDARPGAIIYRDIIPDYVKSARTVYEDDLGEVAVDVNYLNVGDSNPDFQIFIC